MGTRVCAGVRSGHFDLLGIQKMPHQDRRDSGMGIKKMAHQDRHERVDLFAD